MQTLNILENFDLRAMGHNSPEYIHTVAEAIKLSFGDSRSLLRRPRLLTIPIDGLLSKEYAAERARLIDPAKAYPAQPEGGDPWRYSKKARGSNGAQGSNGLPAASDPATADASAKEGTTHVSAMDKHGNMVCGTISGGAFAKSVFFPEIGCALSTRIEMFNCEEGHPNVVEPGKRPRTTLINYIIRKNGQPVMTVGCPGGDNQAQANVQLMLNVILFGMNPQQAVEAPRFATQSNVNSFFPHVYHPGGLTWSTLSRRPLPKNCERWGTGSPALWTAAWALRCLFGTRHRPPQHWRRPASRLLRHRAVGRAFDKLCPAATELSGASTATVFGGRLESLPLLS